MNAFLAHLRAQDTFVAQCLNVQPTVPPYWRRIRSEEVARDRPVAVICGSGYRSSALASLLQHRGHSQVMNVLGGMEGWRTAGLQRQ